MTAETPIRAATPAITVVVTLTASAAPEHAKHGLKHPKETQIEPAQTPALPPSRKASSTTIGPSNWRFNLSFRSALSTRKQWEARLFRERRRVNTVAHFALALIPRDKAGEKLHAGTHKRTKPLARMIY